MRSRLILFTIGIIIWLALTGSFQAENLAIGILGSLFIAWVSGDLFTKNPHKFSQASRYLYFVYYIPIFVWEMIKANLDVAYRVLHPSLPIRPGIVKVKTNLKSEAGRTFLANSITLTPGTLSVDIDEENGYLYIHWIWVKDADIEKASELIVRKFEKILLRIFE